MGWTWELHPARDQATPPPADQPASGFPSQAEAETWVGEVWRDLLDEGVDSVSLYEEGRLVYGPMSLHPME